MITAPHRDNRKLIVILNPKGGCGKTTLATNLASYLALRGPPPTLIDTDPQGFTARWLERRPATNATINGVPRDKLATYLKHGWSFRAPKEATTVIIDTPAGLDQRDIIELTRNADCILIPILPSEFDVHVTSNFIAELLLLTDFDQPIAVVANRTRKRTKSLDRLNRVLTGFETPTIAVLRDSQSYVLAAELGLGIYELPHHRVKEDIEQMERVTGWLDRQLMGTMQPGLISRIVSLPKRHAPSRK